MKNRFKAFIIMIFTFAVFISMQTTAKASTYTNMESKKNVSVSKSWTVNFNYPLSATSVNTTNIKVVGEDSNSIDINVSLANNNKSVVVKPVKNYERNTTYILIITQNVNSEDGKPLPKEVRMNFTTGNSYKIVLDPGHGGIDSGAVGPTGLQEKNVVLAIALKVGNILTKNDVETIYTRTIDKTQSLQEKCDVSNNAKPDYFVSIHANSYTAPAASGTETWYSSGSAAGQKLAQAVQTELIKETGRKDRGIKTAGFYVLNNTDATAILVETAFISNPEEEALLRSDAFQNKLAKAIATGILKCLGITNIVY
jgi:N-acetylmuramoyl-L-alanine amidase